MSRRDLPHRSARRSYVDPEEVYEDEPTRAPRPSVVAPKDHAELALLLDGRDSAETCLACPAYGDPLELEPSANEATRSPRESYVALSDLPQMSRAQTRASSYVAPLEVEGEGEEDEVTSFLDRSSMVAASELRAQGPESVTTYAVRPSYVAPEEQVAASELSTPDELLSYATSEIEEIAPGVDASVDSGPIDYEALSRYLFDDVAPAHDVLVPPPHIAESELHAGERTVLLAADAGPPRSYPRQPVMCVRADLELPIEALSPPVQPMAMRRPMPSLHSYEAVMRQFQARSSSRRSIPSVHPHDSSAESPWIVPAAPSTRRGVTTVNREPFMITPSAVAAALVALLAVAVVVAAVVFVRSDDRSSKSGVSTSTMPIVAPTVVPSAPAALTPPPVIVISSDDILPMAEAPAAAVAPPAPSVAPTAPMPVVTSAPAAATKPVAAAPIVKLAAAPAPPTTARAAPKKPGAKSVEDILNELGEEQLRR